jgi:hypothetical protein
VGPDFLRLVWSSTLLAVRLGSVGLLVRCASFCSTCELGFLGAQGTSPLVSTTVVTVVRGENYGFAFAIVETLSAVSVVSAADVGAAHARRPS